MSPKSSYNQKQLYFYRDFS